MTEAEISALDKYLESGGVAAISGPSAFPSTRSNWTLPTRPNVKAEDFFRYSDGIRIYVAPWVNDIKLPPCEEKNEWREVMSIYQFITKEDAKNA